MDIVLYLLALISAFIGCIAASLHYRGKLQEMQMDLDEAIEDLNGSYSCGWADGYEAANEPDTEEREYYKRMYRQIRGQ